MGDSYGVGGARDSDAARWAVDCWECGATSEGLHLLPIMYPDGRSADQFINLAVGEPEMHPCLTIQTVLSSPLQDPLGATFERATNACPLEGGNHSFVSRFWSNMQVSQKKLIHEQRYVSGTGVEDDMFVRMGAVGLILSAGYEAIEAKDADEAVCILEARQDIDLVFTDVQMPGTMMA